MELELFFFVENKILKIKRHLSMWLGERNILLANMFLLGKRLVMDTYKKCPVYFVASGTLP